MVAQSLRQYEISQMMEEVHFKWNGFSFSHELHAKRIKDTLNNDEETKLLGGFVQAGYFPHRQIAFIPENIELAGRYAFVDMDTDSDKQTELSAVINYFLERSLQQTKPAIKTAQCRRSD